MVILCNKWTLLREYITFLKKGKNVLCSDWTLPSSLSFSFSLLSHFRFPMTPSLLWALKMNSVWWVVMRFAFKPNSLVHFAHRKFLIVKYIEFFFSSEVSDSDFDFVRQVAFERAVPLRSVFSFLRIWDYQSLFLASSSAQKRKVWMGNQIPRRRQSKWDPLTKEKLWKRNVRISHSDMQNVAMSDTFMTWKSYPSLPTLPSNLTRNSFPTTLSPPLSLSLSLSLPLSLFLQSSFLLIHILLFLCHLQACERRCCFSLRRSSEGVHFIPANRIHHHVKQACYSHTLSLSHSHARIHTLGSSSSVSYPLPNQTVKPHFLNHNLSLLQNHKGTLPMAVGEVGRRRLRPYLRREGRNLSSFPYPNKVSPSHSRHSYSCNQKLISTALLTDHSFPLSLTLSFKRLLRPLSLLSIERVQRSGGRKHRWPFDLAPACKMVSIFYLASAFPWKFLFLSLSCTHSL